MRLKAKFMGQLDFTFNNKSITSFLSEKACGLLCYLMVNNSKTHYRDHLTDIFWENNERESANNNLRYSLWSIRKQLETTKKSHQYILNVNKHTIKFTEAGSYTFDVLDFKHLIKNSEDAALDIPSKIELMEKASQLYSGAFLENFYIKDAPFFNDWVFYEREELQRSYFKLQMNLSKEYEKQKWYIKAIDPLNKLVKFDPLHEELYLHLIKLNYLSGNRAASIETYHKLKKLLREELNISPSKEIQELYNHIRKEERNPPTHEIKSISGVSKISNLIAFDNKGTNIRIFTTSSEENISALKTVFQEIPTQRDYIIIDMLVEPGQRVEYEGVYEIAEKLLCIINKREQTEDLEKAVSCLNQILKSLPIEEYVLFLSLCSILDLLGKEVFILKFYNLHWCDCKTIDFISFLTRKCPHLNIHIIGIYDSNWKNHHFQLFKKAFHDTEFAQFISIS